MLSYLLSFIFLANAYPCSINLEQLQKKNMHYIFDNTKSKTNLPRRFRTSKEISPNLPPEIQSFRNFNIVGSAQFSSSQFYAILDYLKTNYCVLPEQVYVVDLREEPHFFIDDYSITVAQIGATKDKNKFSSFEGINDQTLVEMERFYCEQVLNQKNIIVHKLKSKKAKYEIGHKSITLSVTNTQTEKNIVEKAGSHYLRLLVTDHKHPSPEVTRQFIDFINELPEGAWLYFHCRGGVGRTSSLTLMYDILKNAKNLSLNTLIKRNLAFGNTNKLFDMTKVDTLKIKEALDRRQFLEKFYTDVKAALK